MFLKLALGGHNYTGWDDVIQLSPWSTDVYSVSCINPLDDLDIHIDLTCSGGVNRSVGVNSVQVDDVRVSRADDERWCECRAGQMGGSRYINGAIVKFEYSECILYTQVSCDVSPPSFNQSLIFRVS